MLERRDIIAQLCSSNLALMLSWHEGFGLTGWEAIACETPLILSTNSGLYRLIDETLGGAGRGCVTGVEIAGARGPSKSFTQNDLKRVSEAITALAGRIPQALDDARRLKKALQDALGATWAHTAKTFLDAVSGPSPVRSIAIRAEASSQRPKSQPVASQVNRVPSCVELSISTTQGSSETQFDLLAELRFGRDVVETEGVTIEFGLTDAVMGVQANGCQIFGKRLGDIEHPFVAAEAGSKWRISGPRDDLGMLSRQPLGDDILCRLQIESGGVVPGVEAVVSCRRSQIRYVVLDAETDVIRTLPVNKEAILAIFLNRCLLPEGGGVELGRATLTWQPGDPDADA